MASSGRRGVSVWFNPRDPRTGHDGGMTSQSWHIGERIDRPADEVYAYAANPANLPRRAPGPGGSVTEAVAADLARLKRVLEE